MGLSLEQLKTDIAFRRDLDEWIAAHRDEMVDELIQWASYPSVSQADLAGPGAPFGPDCRKMLDFALSRGEAYGFTSENYEGYCGAIRYGPAEKEIGFACHLDVVPPGEKWNYDPYQPFEKDGFLIRRGVSDNKYAGVAILFLLRFLKEKEIPLEHGICLFLGCAEETGMEDFRWYVNEYKGRLPGLTLVPDGMFPVNYAQKGGVSGLITIPAGRDIIVFDGGDVVGKVPDRASVTLKNIPFWEVLAAIGDSIPLEAVLNTDGTVTVTARGKAGHSAFPERGTVNAIALLAGELVETGLVTKADLTGVEALNTFFHSPYGDGLGLAFEDAESGRLTLNAGIVTKRENRIEVSIDIRYPITMDRETIFAGIEAAAAPFLPEGHGGGHEPDESMNIDNWITAFKIYTYAVLLLDTMEFDHP